MSKIALQLITTLLSMIDRELFVEVVDYLIDRIEAKYHDGESWQDKAVMSVCATARVTLGVPDEEGEDQANPV